MMNSGIELWEGIGWTYQPDIRVVLKII